MLLLNLYNLILVVVLYLVDLLIVNVLQMLPCLLGVNILSLDFNHISLKF